MSSGYDDSLAAVNPSNPLRLPLGKCPKCGILKLKTVKTLLQELCMKKQQMSIHDLEKEVQEIVLHIEEIEKNIGTIVLPAGDSRVLQEDLLYFTSLGNDQKAIMNSIASLENLQSQITEAKAKQKTIQERITTLSSEWNEKYTIFGKTLVANYNPQMASVIGQNYTEIQALLSKIEELEIQFETDKSALEKQGFFTKMINQVKLSSLGTSISAQKRRLENLYTSAGKTAYESGALKKEYDERTLDILILQSLDALGSLSEEIEHEKKNLDEASREEKELNTALESIGVSGSFNKKLEHFSNRLLGKQNELLQLYKKTGHEYISKYVYADGSKPVKLPSDLDASVSQMIKEAQKQSASLYVFRQKIEILQLTGQISEKEKSIASMQQSIIDNDVRISRLQVQNADFAEKITAQANEKDELLIKKAELEKSIS